MEKTALKKLLFLFMGLGIFYSHSVNTISFGDLTVVDDSKYQEDLEEALRLIFKDVESDLTDAYKDYAGSIAQQALKLGSSITSTQATTFKDYVNSRYTIFKTACSAASNKALKAYYAFLEEQGRSTTSVDATAQGLIDSLAEIQVVFEYDVTNFTVTTMSGSTLDDMLKNLSQEIAQHDAEAEAAFLKKQSDVIMDIDISLWDRIVYNLDQYWPILGEQLLSDLGETMGDIIEDRIGAFGDFLVDITGDAVSKLSDKVKEKAGELLEKMGKELTPKIEEIIEKFLPKLEPLLKLLGKEIENHSLAVLTSLLREFLRTQFTVDNDFTSISVSTSEDLSSKEQEFVKARTTKVNEALKSNFDVNVPLNIGMMSSGNGVRSGYFHIGSVLAMQKAKLWDAILYNAGTSASSWTIFASSYAQLVDGVEMEDYLSALLEDGRVFTDLPQMDPSEYGDIAIWLGSEFAYELPCSSADLLGPYIAGRTLLEDSCVADLNDMYDKVSAAGIPYPLAGGIYSRGTVDSSTGEVKEDKASDDDKKEEKQEEKKEITDEQLEEIADEIQKSEDKGDEVDSDELDDILNDILGDLDDEDNSSSSNASGADSTGNTMAIVPYTGDSSSSDDDIDVDALLNDALDNVAGQAETEKAEKIYGWVEFSVGDIRDLASKTHQSDHMHSVRSLIKVSR